MKTQKFSLEELKRTDMVEYLEKLGYQPAKITRTDYWYLSPFRTEKTASFKINRKRNCWFDFGEGTGGNLVDFCLRFYNCSIKELFDIVPVGQINPLEISTLPEGKVSGQSKIEIIDVLPITNLALLDYLISRKIPVSIAQKFCSEVHYELYHKNYFAIGFRNDLGGYELRNKYFKGSSSPKSTRFIDYNSNHLLVFEGFFSFLSYTLIEKYPGLELTNYLVLNSLSFLGNQRKLMERHDNIDLYLDRDDAGRKATQKVLTWSPKFHDASILYNDCKDLNHWLQQHGNFPNKMPSAED